MGLHVSFLSASDETEVVSDHTIFNIAPPVNHIQDSWAYESGFYSRILLLSALTFYLYLIISLI
jgi:hypothetical protein